MPDVEYTRALQVIKARGVSDTRGTRTRVIQNERNTIEVLKCLYQVRCNLFHGGKLPGDPRDEGLVEAAYTVTSKLIGPLIAPGAV